MYAHNRRYSKIHKSVEFVHDPIGFFLCMSAVCVWDILVILYVYWNQDQTPD